MSTLADEIKALKDDLTIEYNPYFASLADGSFSREDFIETQIQFLFAVVFFSRPMAVLAAIIGCLAVAGGLAGSMAFDTPSGPSIVVAAFALFLVSALNPAP